jgi:hypothetical protein
LENTGVARYLALCIPFPGEIRSFEDGWKNWNLDMSIALQSMRLRGWKRVIRRLRLAYEEKLGRSPRLLRPRRFTEKMQWRKLFDLDPTYAVFCDKVATRQYVADRLGMDAVVPLLWIGSDPAAIPFATLRPPYIIKCSHGSGWNIVVRDDKAVDHDGVRAQLAAWLATDYGMMATEPGYSAVPRRLLIEPLLTYRGSYPPEYRLFMFDGVARLVVYRMNYGDLHHEEAEAYYDPQWRHLPVRTSEMPWTEAVARPSWLDALLATAKRLAGGRDFIRIDFLVDDNQIYVGELSLYHMSGMFQFEPDEQDLALGEYWRLRRPLWRACRTIITRDWGAPCAGS